MIGDGGDDQWRPRISSAIKTGEHPNDWKWECSGERVWVTARKKRWSVSNVASRRVPPAIQFDNSLSPIPPPMAKSKEDQQKQNSVTFKLQPVSNGYIGAHHGSSDGGVLLNNSSTSLSTVSSSSSSYYRSSNTFVPDESNLLLEISIPILLLACCISQILSLPISLAIYCLFRLLILTYDYLWRAIWTLPRDIKGLILLIRIKFALFSAFRSNQPLHTHFLEFVQRHPQKECLIEVKTGRRMNFAQFNAHSNKYANLFDQLDFHHEDILALFMENGIEFFAAWLGLSKIGVITAWINTNVKLEPLAHSIKISKCKSVMTTPSLLPVLMNAIEQNLLPNNLNIFIAFEGNTVKKMNNGKGEYSLDNGTEPKTPKSLNFQSVLCYIYTSGTTGSPKAAIIKHYRYFLIGMGSGHAFGIEPSDRLYIMMPMYHSAGGILGASQILIRGCSAAIRTKFSASNFWQDCIQFDCTVSQYIGEICRYLLAQPPSREERNHKIRLMFGNGLRPQIWKEFVARFGISKIGEIYGSTEGNSNLLNIDNNTGSCGFMPIYPFLHALYPIRLLKVDKNGELERDDQGYCIQCRPGDTGEVVATIRNDDPLLRFEGYVDAGDTKKKIIHNCCRPGDTVFTSGDILLWDRYGYLYFKDRRGDTYRWRGENVSTMEVEGVLQPIHAIANATVYGVQVPGREGKAGMIGVALQRGTDVEEFIEQLSARLLEHLASYAIPVFLRICDEVDLTGTFKLKKSRFQNEGFDLLLCAGNPLFYWDGQRYAPLTEKMHKMIRNGEYSKI